MEPTVFTATPQDASKKPAIAITNLTMAFGSFLIQRDLTFNINRGDIFIVMGGSGCGKSTLLRHLIGLNEPAKGDIAYGNTSLVRATPPERAAIMRNIGVLYQTGGLWSSMTLAENIGLPLGEYTDLSQREIRDIASLKLALVGLAGFEDYYPSEISGGMQKRAGLARAMALDPEILFFDEPTTGIDPIMGDVIDNLIVQWVRELGATAITITHDMESARRGDQGVTFWARKARVLASERRWASAVERPTAPKARRVLRPATVSAKWLKTGDRRRDSVRLSSRKPGR